MHAGGLDGLRRLGEVGAFLVLFAILSGCADAGPTALPGVRRDRTARVASEDDTLDAGSPEEGIDAAAEWLSADPKVRFSEAQADLGAACGGCHAGGQARAPAFLKGPDVYATLTSYEGIRYADPFASILLTKGVHAGPALTEPARTKVLRWLTAESPSAPAAPVSSPTVTIAAGSGTLDLSTLVPGTSLTFRASLVGSDLALSELRLSAPLSRNIHLRHPVFHRVPTTGPEVVNDTLSNVDMTVAAGQSTLLGPGTVRLANFAAADRLRIVFVRFETTQAAVNTGVCRAPLAFATHAVPALTLCVECHRKGKNGYVALDLSALATLPRNDAAACAAALGRVTKSDPSGSPLVLAPTGGIGIHPFKWAPPSFAPAMLAWISAEL